MACGVPVLLEESKARRENLGSAYPFFVPFGSLSLPVNGTKKKLLYKKIQKIIANKLLRKKTSKYLIDRAKFYSIEQSGVRLKNLFESIILQRDKI